MKNILIKNIFFLLLLFFSCKKTEEDQKKYKYKVEIFIDSIINKNPKRNFNTIYKTAFDSVFR